MNIRFSPSSVQGEDGTRKLKELIQTYFELGGMQLQFNVVSTAALRAARADPMEYRDLVIRIAGFSTYFVSLAPEVQEDFITRTEMSL
jgi:formate C-acetyltransferase